jgi:hypothetical protein
MSKVPAYTAKLSTLRRDMLALHERAARIKVGSAGMGAPLRPVV